MQPAISQVSSLPSPLAADVQEYAAGQCRALEVWLTKLEDYLAQHSLADLRRLLAQNQMTTPVAALQGGLWTSPGAARQAAWELFGRRLALCQAAGIGTLVVAGDFRRPLQPQDVDRALMSLREAAQLAERHGVRLALEFQADAGFANNLASAATLVAQIGSPQLGLCLDAFHFYVGPSKTEDLELLTLDNLFHVQLCDLAGVPREWATDAQRILPGDGEIPLAAIVDRLRALNFPGHVSVELLNPQLWQVPPRQLGEIALTALRRVLGQASMG